MNEDKLKSFLSTLLFFYVVIAIIVAKLNPLDWSMSSRLWLVILTILFTPTTSKDE